MRSHRKTSPLINNNSLTARLLSAAEDDDQKEPALGAASAPDPIAANPIVANPRPTRSTEMVTTPPRLQSSSAASSSSSSSSAASSSSSANLTIDGIKQKFLNGESLSTDENALLQKALGDEYINFKAEYYRTIYTLAYSRYLTENICSLILEVAYAFYQFNTSKEGIQHFSEVVLGKEVSEETADVLGKSGAILDFIANVTTFDAVEAANLLIVKYAEKKQGLEQQTDPSLEVGINTIEARRRIAKIKGMRLLAAGVHQSICLIHNLTGGYADVIGIDDKLGPPASRYLTIILMLYFTHVYYDRFLTPKYEKGCKDHLEKEWLITKMKRGEIALPIHVGFQILSAIFLRSISFMYLQPAVESGFGWWFDKISIGALIGCHTFMSRFFSTYDRYYGAENKTHQLLNGDQRVAVINAMFEKLNLPTITNPDQELEIELLRVLLKQYAAKLRQDRSYLEAIKNEWQTGISGMARTVCASYLLGPQLMWLMPHAAIPQVGYYIVGGLLALWHFQTAESQRVAYDIVYDELKKVANNAAEASAEAHAVETGTATQSTSAMPVPRTAYRDMLLNGFAVIACAASNISRGISNVTFGVRVGSSLGIDKSISVPATAAISLETSTNGYLLSIQNNKDSMKSVYRNGAKLLGWMSKCCKKSQTNSQSEAEYSSDYDTVPEPETSCLARVSRCSIM